MKLSHYLSLFIAMLSCTLVHAENAPEWHGGKSTYVAVDIDAQGKVLDVAPQNTKLAPAVNQALEQAVHGWTFNVTAGKGAATTAKTYLLVRTEMRDDGKNIDLRFVYVGNGPMLEIPPPVYPSSSVSGRAEAALTFTATVTPDGHLTDVQLESATTTDGQRATAFTRSAKAALAKAHVHPIVLGGMPISSRVRGISLQYTLHNVMPTTAAQKAAFSSSLSRSYDSPGAPPPVNGDDATITLDSPIAMKKTAARTLRAATF